MTKLTVLLGATLLIVSTVAIYDDTKLREDNQRLQSELYSQRMIETNITPILTDVIYSNAQFDEVVFDAANNTTYRFYNSRINNSIINKAHVYDSYIENSTINRTNIKGYITYSTITNAGVCGLSFDMNDTNISTTGKETAQE